MTARTMHSPGPWEVERDLTVTFHPLAVSNGTHCIADLTDQHECEANARLIARAPDLLAALSEVRDFWAGGDCPEPLMARIEALLERVRGEA